jgi:hypothetical protein
MAQEYILVEAGHKRKLLAALLPSVITRTVLKSKSWWTCAMVPHPRQFCKLQDNSAEFWRQFSLDIFPEKKQSFTRD